MTRQIDALNYRNNALSIILYNTQAQANLSLPSDKHFTAHSVPNAQDTRKITVIDEVYLIGLALATLL